MNEDYLDEVMVTPPVRGRAFRLAMARRYKRDTYAQIPKSFTDIKKSMKKRGCYTPKVKGEKHRVLNADFWWNMT